MKADVRKWLALLIATGLYWHMVCQVTGVDEPWDAKTCWSIWHPVSLILSAAAGAFISRRAWLAGALVTFSQLAILAINRSDGAMWIVALVMTAMFAIPAIAVSALAGWYAGRIRCR